MTTPDRTATTDLRRLALALFLAVFAITAGNLACTNSIKSVDRSDETDGAT